MTLTISSFKAVMRRAQGAGRCCASFALRCVVYSIPEVGGLSELQFV